MLQCSSTQVLIVTQSFSFSQIITAVDNCPDSVPHRNDGMTWTSTVKLICLPRATELWLCLTSRHPLLSTFVRYSCSLLTLYHRNTIHPMTMMMHCLKTTSKNQEDGCLVSWHQICTTQFNTHAGPIASNLEQVANRLCAQINSASYPQWDEKWVPANVVDAVWLGSEGRYDSCLVFWWNCDRLYNMFIHEYFRGMFTIRCYTNPHILYIYLLFILEYHRNWSFISIELWTQPVIIGLSSRQFQQWLLE